jgi:hypothetical protein
MLASHGGEAQRVGGDSSWCSGIGAGGGDDGFELGLLGGGASNQRLRRRRPLYTSSSAPWRRDRAPHRFLDRFTHGVLAAFSGLPTCSR